MANGSEPEDFKPDPQIVVTDQMVEAGARELDHWHPEGLLDRSAQLMARDGYLAMTLARREGCKETFGSERDRRRSFP